MAKLRGAKKAAFLRRMARGRKQAGIGQSLSRSYRHEQRHSGTPSGRRKLSRRFKTRVRALEEAHARRARLRRKRNGLNSYNPARRVRRRRFRRNPTAVIANPGYSKAYAAGWSAAFGKKKRKKRKGTSMAKRRRKRRASARRAAPRRRVRRRRPVSRRRAHRRHRRGGGRAGGLYVIRGRRINPRRRGGRRRRRNPGMGGLLKRAFVPYAVGFITSGAMGVLDAGLANYPMAKNVGKVLLAIGVAATVGNKHPVAATAAISAIAASQGYAFGTRMAGGMVASNPAQAVQGLGAMSATYPEMGALLNGGVGALLNGPPDIDDAVVNYATALNNMASEDD